MDFREVSEPPEILCVSLGLGEWVGSWKRGFMTLISSKWSLQQRVNIILKDMTFKKNVILY